MSKITFAVRVVRDFIVLLENRNEVVSMLFADVLDTGVVNADRESDRAPSLRPKTQYDFTLFVALLVEPFFEQLLVNYAGVWETVHSPCDYYVYPAVSGVFFFEVVVRDSVFWEVAEFEAHVFATVLETLPNSRMVVIGPYINCCLTRLSSKSDLKVARQKLYKVARQKSYSL